MQIRFNKYVEIAFLVFAVIGIAGRLWVLPEVPYWVHILLFIFQFIGSNILWIFYYNLDFQLNKYYPFEKNTQKRVIIQVVLGWGITKLIFLPFLFFFIENFVFNTLFTPNQELNKLNIVSFFFLAFTISVLINLGFIANHFFQRWKENETRAANLEKEKSQVQFDNLKNQLNPHFLFNSLTSLDSLIQDNPELARKFLQQLSKVYRYVLQSKENGLVSLQEELDFIKNYVELLKTRFGGYLSINIDVKSEDLDKRIAPVTLQILIENAIKHNIINKDNPLIINILSNESCLIVENNIQLKKQVETSNKQGLNNLKSLYEFLSEKQIEITNDLYFFKVAVPLI
jgi:two-component system, LytTR family, sensor kinase